MKLWWSSSSGRIELSMTLEQAESVSQGGMDALPFVLLLKQDDDIKNQLSKIGDDVLISELSEFGAWDESELSNRQFNEERLLWIAGNDIVEEHYNVHD